MRDMDEKNGRDAERCIAVMDPGRNWIWIFALC